MSASGLVLSYRRIGNLPAIVGNMIASGLVTDVVVAHNDPDRPLSHRDFPDLPREQIIILNSGANRYTYGRFLALPACQHDTVLTCDDDVLQLDWHGILETFRQHPESIVAAMPPGHRRHHAKLAWETAREILLGWGAAFDRRWAVPAFEPYIARHGHDKVLERKADRLFSILLDRLHTVLDARFVELPGARQAGLALCTLPDHSCLNDLARTRALAILRALRRRQHEEVPA